MARREFTKPTRREALKRSGLRCEGIGQWYGHPAGHRCNADLGKGVQFDHIDLDANSKDNSLENCAAVCIPCHRFKTAKIDQPKAAKTLRQQDKALGIRKPSTFPGGRNSRFKRTMSGKVVDRQTGMEVGANGSHR